MAGKHRSGGNRRSLNAKANRRARLAGAGVAAGAGAFLTLGMSPWVASLAHAEVSDLGVDSAAGAASFVDAQTCVADPRNCVVDSGAAVADPLSVLAGRSATSADSSAGVDAVVANVFKDFIDNPTLAADQAWMAGPTDEAMYEALNAPSVMLVGRKMIGDGVDGFSGPNTSLLGWTGVFGDLGDGGFLVGNGGDGAAGVNGGAGRDGGDAGFFGGNGGDGGAGADGVDGAEGGAGGAGGNGGFFSGDGGRGGAGGAGFT